MSNSSYIINIEGDSGTGKTELQEFLYTYFSEKGFQVIKYNPRGTLPELAHLLIEGSREMTIHSEHQTLLALVRSNDNTIILTTRLFGDLLKLRNYQSIKLIHDYSKHVLNIELTSGTFGNKDLKEYDYRYIKFARVDINNHPKSLDCNWIAQHAKQKLEEMRRR